jgi:Holliday junction DNA helicase RuvA
VIGSLRGRLIAKHPPGLVIEVGGVGYECEAPMSTFYHLPALGSEVTLRTHLVVREDAHLLFAFATEDERRLFRGLLKVSGIGPKIALAILSGTSVADFLRVIEAEDVDQLVRVPGVGRKTAERLIIEMRDRVKDFGGVHLGLARPTDEPRSAKQEASSALVALGYKPAEISRLLATASEDVISTEELIRHALKAAAT